MQDTSYLDDEILDNPNQPARHLKLCAYLSASIVIGTALWGAALSVPFLWQGLNPITVASQAVGYEQMIDDPLIVARESELRLIEPAAGPSSGD